jgi:hypothetical protein
MSTPEKFNGMTPDQIKEWLADKERFVFIKRNKIASLEYIKRLEKKVKDADAAIDERDMVINLMKIQMRGDCGCCAHGKDGKAEPCASCLASKEYHPRWEYEGLPEVKSK